MQFLRAYPEQGQVEQDDPAQPVRFVASTEGIKRDGKDLKADDWDFSRYEKLPTVLWAHDFFGQNLPLGRGQIFLDERTLMIDVFYDTADPFAMAVRRKARMGIVGTSVSWDEVERGGKRVNELTEVSNVPIPLDPDAVPVREMEGLAKLRAWLEEVVKAPTPDPSPAAKTRGRGEGEQDQESDAEEEGRGDVGGDARGPGADSEADGADMEQALRRVLSMLNKAAGMETRPTG